MSCRDWLHNAAIGGCLSLALCVALAGEGRAQSNDSAQTQKAEPQQAPPTPAPVVDEKIPDADYYKPRCDRPKDGEEADLCEQRRMAQAAEDAVWWAAFQTRLGVAGFVAVVLSLAFTGWAAVAAGKAAKMAQASVGVASDTAQRQLRAYLVVRKASVIQFEPGKKLTAKLTFVNCGQTPARDVTATVIITPIKLPLTTQLQPVEPDDKSIASKGSVAADKEMTVTISTKQPFPQNYIDGLHKGELMVYAHGCVWYRDVYKRDHFTKFRVQFGAKELRDNVLTMASAPGGNEES